MKRNPSLRWALVLSGGGAKGIAHVGVLKALERLGAPEPSLVVGTSMGAIVGGLYACGKKAGDLEDFIVRDFDIRNYLDSSSFRLSGPVGRILQTGQAIGNLATRPGMDSGRRILAVLQDLSGNASFDQTRIPFRCNAVDLISGEERVLSTGSVARAIRASMSFPAFFDPLAEDGMLLVDGGLVNNLPVRIAREAGFRRILAVDVGGFRSIGAAELRSGAAVSYRSLEVAIHHILRGDADQASLTIHPVDGSSPFAFARARRLIALGEETVVEHKDRMEAFFSGGLRAALRLRGKPRITPGTGN